MWRLGAHIRIIQVQQRQPFHLPPPLLRPPLPLTPLLPPPPPLLLPLLVELLPTRRVSRPAVSLSAAAASSNLCCCRVMPAATSCFNRCLLGMSCKCGRGGSGATLLALRVAEPAGTRLEGTRWGDLEGEPAQTVGGRDTVGYTGFITHSQAHVACG